MRISARLWGGSDRACSWGNCLQQGRSCLYWHGLSITINVYESDLIIWNSAPNSESGARMKWKRVRWKHMWFVRIKSDERHTSCTSPFPGRHLSPSPSFKTPFKVSQSMHQMFVLPLAHMMKHCTMHHYDFVAWLIGFLITWRAFWLENLFTIPVGSWTNPTYLKLIIIRIQIP